ncbi:MAG: hypothetical protein A3E85_01725 [Gammaproteobacteria bacterium RIFCSPHIGHO2_12_FULL_45_12]|nr:MAG: hypothetical protein A3E85_01725 [Gammaproteobacteria bacterium RIFCSPHIGHO2_12_FULL_45_12]
MADAIDIANDLIDIEVARALSKMRGAASGSQKRVKQCIECNDDIPEGRQALGFALCVPCAEEVERRRNLFSESMY